MIAFKGVSPDLTARMGRGRCQFVPGKTKYEDKSKTYNCGFHCCENPFDCLNYYSLGSDRFFMVEAAGSIDEDDGNRIACTEITLLQELDVKQFAGYGMAYMVQHPRRKGWECDHGSVLVARDKADGGGADFIVIARGAAPMARAGEGKVIGLIQEPREGEITAARVFTVSRQQAGKWYTLGRNGKIEEAADAV